jgi:hypothetical protein
MEKTTEHVARRKELFKQIDMNGNGYVSLAEMDKGIRDVLKCREIFDAKPVIARAFHAAKNAVKSSQKDKLGDDYVT